MFTLLEYMVSHLAVGHTFPAHYRGAGDKSEAAGCFVLLKVLEGNLHRAFFEPALVVDVLDDGHGEEGDVGSHLDPADGAGGGPALVAGGAEAVAGGAAVDG